MQTAESMPPASLPASSTCSHKDEVVVNVSVNDPLTRETQHKIITASRRQNSLDARFTPKSIAQRGFGSTPKQPEGTAPTKKPATSGVINFFPNRQQQVTTVTSGGYVIGCAPETVPTSKTTVEEPTQNINTLQQKRKNLKNALNNIKAVNAGQISLLKVSQKLGQNAQAHAHAHAQPQPKAVEPPTLLVEDDVPAEPLPEKMIIAAAKQQKHQLQVAPQSNPHIEPASEPQMQSEPTDLSKSARPSIPDDILLGKVIKDGDLLKLILKALKWPATKHTMEAQLDRLRNSRFATIMADPNLLQDADLTQIMGPYLGPVLQAAQMLQQQQVAAAAAAAAAATKETELQVAGITTALPYKLPAETSVQLVPASPEEEAEVSDITPKASASNQSLKRNAKDSNTKVPPSKKVRKMSARGRSASIFNSDEYAALNSTLTSQFLNSKSTPDIHVDLDPATLFTHLGMLSGLSATSSNDALLALLQRQRAALSRLQQSQSQSQSQPQPQPRRQRSNSIITVPASGSDFVFDTDDIILMEPDDCTESTTTNSQNNGDGNTGSSLNFSQNESITFPAPQQTSKLMITRPIIKRRKTVIQASPARLNLAVNTKEVTPFTSTPSESEACTAPTTKLVTVSSNVLPQTVAPPKKPSKTQSLDSLNTISTQFPSNIISIGTQAPSNTTNVNEAVPTTIVTKATETMLTATATAATSVSSLAVNNTATTNTAAVGRTTTRNSNAVKRVTSSKSALGQQLLEAIGLQKVASENKDVAVVSATTPGLRGSVQQIRSALKKSLQKAQEQQQQRSRKVPFLVATEDNSEEAVNVVKEVVVQPRAKHASNTPTGPLDVEEEINKITLVLQSKAKDDKKLEEADKRLTAAAPSRIPGIRRKLMPPTIAIRNRKSTVTLVAEEIVDLIDDEENQDAAERKNVAKNKDKDIQ